MLLRAGGRKASSHARHLGDRIIQHSRRVDQADRVGTIVEVHGEDGPFLVRFEGRDPCLVFPGPDAEIAVVDDHSS